ncbi:unnamed protein product, partial [Prorocentrum cordatum]
GSSEPEEDALPLSYGEQLVLQTYLHSKRRPYDKQRQEALAKPRKPLGDDASLEQQHLQDDRRLDKQEVQQMVDRLYKPKPKRFQMDDAEVVLLELQQQQSARRKDFDLDAMVARLYVPKPPKSLEVADDESTFSISASPPRPPDKERLRSLARPKNRGASAEAWGLRPAQADEAGASPDDWALHAGEEELPYAGGGGGSPGGGSAAGPSGSRTARAHVSEHRSRVDGRWARAGFAQEGRPIGSSILASAGYDGVTRRHAAGSLSARRPAPWMLDDSGDPADDMELENEDRIEQLIERTADKVVDKAMKKMEEVATKVVKQELDPVKKELAEHSAAIKKLQQQSALSTTGPPSTTGSAYSRPPGSRGGSQAFTPGCIELKGWIKDWNQPDATALLDTEAQTLIEAIIAGLEGEMRDLIDVERSVKSAQAHTFHKKLQVHLKIRHKDDAWRLRKAVADFIARGIPNFQNTTINVTVEGPPDQRPLYRAAAKFYEQLEAKRIDTKQVKMEYYKSFGRHPAKLSVVAKLPNMRPDTVAEYTEGDGWTIREAVWTHFNGGTVQELYSALSAVRSHRDVEVEEVQPQTVQALSVLFVASRETLWETHPSVKRFGKTDEAEHDFRESVETELLGQLHSDQPLHKKLEACSDTVTRLASTIGNTTLNQRRRQCQVKPDAVRKLEQEAALATSPETKKDVGSRLKRAQREWRRARLRAMHPAGRPTVYDTIATFGFKAELGFGLRINGTWYTHLCWADNLVLLGRTLGQIESMWQQLTGALLRHGLFWKPGSMEILSPSIPSQIDHVSVNLPVPVLDALRPDMPDNFEAAPVPRAAGPQPAVVGTYNIPVVESITLLGSILHREGLTEPMVEHRVSKAMGAYFSEKALHSRILPLDERLRRYSELLPPILLYNSETWAIGKSTVQRLRQIEGHWLRRIVGGRRRRPGEGLGAYLRAMTRHARKYYATHGHLLIEERLLAKYHAAASNIHCAGCVQEKWYTDCHLHLDEAAWRTTVRVGNELQRKGKWVALVGRDRWRHRPGWKKRLTWEDLAIDYCEERWGDMNWRLSVKNGRWHPAQEHFVQWSLRHFGYDSGSLLAARRARQHAQAQGATRARHRVTFEHDVKWRQDIDKYTVTCDLQGDSKVAIQWLAGAWRCTQAGYLRGLGVLQVALHEAWRSHHIQPAEVGGLWVRHCFREHNRRADTVAGLAWNRRACRPLSEIRDSVLLRLRDSPPPWRVQAAFDGSWKAGRGAWGIVFWLHTDNGPEEIWCRGGPATDATSALDAELQGRAPACSPTTALRLQLAAAPPLLGTPSPRFAASRCVPLLPPPLAGACPPSRCPGAPARLPGRGAAEAPAAAGDPTRSHPSRAFKRREPLHLPGSLGATAEAFGEGSLCEAEARAARAPMPPADATPRVDAKDSTTIRSLSTTPEATRSGLDPESVARHKEELAKDIEERLQRAVEALDESLRNQTEQLHAAAGQQRTRFHLETDRQVKQNELMLTQKHNEELMRLQQAAQAKRAELEQRATEKTLEFQQRKVHEEFLVQQREIQQQHQEQQQRIDEELKKLGTAVAFDGLPSAIMMPLAAAGAAAPPPAQPAAAPAPGALAQPRCGAPCSGTAVACRPARPSSAPRACSGGSLAALAAGSPVVRLSTGPAGVPGAPLVRTPP